MIGKRTAVISVYIGKTEDVRTDTSFVEITVGDPEIADVNPLTDRSISILGKKSDDQMTIIFRDVQDAAQRYAIAHNFEMVLNYTDATTTADYYGAPNIASKLQTRACMPLYMTPGLEISYEVVLALNAAYSRTATPAAGTVTPRPNGN